MSARAGSVAALLAVAVAAQQPPSAGPAPAPATQPNQQPQHAPSSVAHEPDAPAAAHGNVHAAWLRELIDLDVAGAARDYSDVLRDPQQPELDRLVATARLLELRRLGVGTDLPAPNLGEIRDPAVQQHLLRPPPPALDELMDAARAEGTTSPTELPQLRPFVSLVLWQAFQERERLGRGRPAPGSRRADTARLLAWVRAKDIARAQLDGRTEDADELRRQRFTTWKPPQWPGTAVVVWPRVRTALQRWAQERQLLPNDLELLNRLQTALEHAAAADPQRAMDLLDRLPLFADRLRSLLDA